MQHMLLPSQRRSSAGGAMQARMPLPPMACLRLTWRPPNLQTKRVGTKKDMLLASVYAAGVHCRSEG